MSRKADSDSFLPHSCDGQAFNPGRGLAVERTQTKIICVICRGLNLGNHESRKGISEIEGKVAQAAATECGKGWSFNPRRFAGVPDPILWLASDADALQLLVTVQLVSA